MELENNVKQIKIILDAKSKKYFQAEGVLIEEDENGLTNEIKKEQEKKMRVETKTWGLSDEDLEHEKQLNAINDIIYSNEVSRKYNSKILSHIKTKIHSYKQQDIIKKRLNEDLFVSLKEVLELLESCKLSCHYCNDNVYILYEIVREVKQWSLDRIDNDIGHNGGNLVVACLECNLKRRRTNKEAFYFTKNLVITREGIDS
jgi:hypothetical protein